jgi:hypothetical protein
MVVACSKHVESNHSGWLHHRRLLVEGTATRFSGHQQATGCPTCVRSAAYHPWARDVCEPEQGRERNRPAEATATNLPPNGRAAAAMTRPEKLPSRESKDGEISEYAPPERTKSSTLAPRAGTSQPLRSRTTTGAPHTSAQGNPVFSMPMYRMYMGCCGFGGSGQMTLGGRRRR